MQKGEKMEKTIAEKKQEALAKRKERIKKNPPELYARIRAQGFEIGDSLEDMADAKLRRKNKLGEKGDGKKS